MKYRVEVLTEETVWCRQGVEVEADSPADAQLRAVQWVDDEGGPGSWVHSEHGATEAVSVEELGEGGAS